MIIPPRKSIRLKHGFTYDDYLIKCNEGDASYNELCYEMNLTIAEAKAIYDKVYCLKPKDIGTIKRSKPKPKPKYPYWN